MIMWQTYRAYIKDNPKKYWFKRRWYGWGWVPVRWPGWLTLIAFIGYLVWIALDLGRLDDPTDSEILAYMMKLAAGVAAVIAIAYLTGEKPTWQWGPPKK